MIDDVVKTIESLLKYRGTNYAQVASKLGMSRQAFFRMVKGGTIKFSTFLKMLDVLGLGIRIADGGDIACLTEFKGPKLKKKIKGVLYDTEKLMSVGVLDCTEGVTTELCVEPVSKTYLVLRYSEDGYSKFEIADETKLSILKSEHSK